MKLKHVADEGYSRHLMNANIAGIKSIAAGVVIIIHSIVPKLFPNLGTRILLSVVSNNIRRSSNNTDHIQIRYNTNSKDEKLPWRIVVNGIERLAQDVSIVGVAFGEKSYVKDVAKYNLAIHGTVTWVNDHAIIISRRP